uniref:Very-long-chain (3R)-3-hydroxyacyl-CoA dehydratase n=1 Tax=Phallusia mammillata TaxID=59560 RepID=A0A6F9DEV7_9ASCI|nr:very-long-chain (3R)-3-hydroxyacyl-CoA dehydratase 2-like [Phallusia mammillata]
MTAPQTTRKQSPIAQAWLIMYNVAMTAGWLVIGLGIVNHFYKHRTHKGLYRQVEKQLLFFQTAAIFEIIHAATGIVRSNVMLTTMQVFSRVGIVWGVIQPVAQVHNTEGIPMLMVAWTITEIIRYLYYTFMLLGTTPYIVVWLRYSLFTVLYPLGVSGELLSIYNSLKPVRDSQMYSLFLPNQLNFSIDYHIVLIGTIPFYFIFFPQLYFHMFAQRKKLWDLDLRLLPRKQTDSSILDYLIHVVQPIRNNCMQCEKMKQCCVYGFYSSIVFLRKKMKYDILD